MANPYAIGAEAGLNIVTGLQQAELIRANADITKRVSDMNAQFADLDAFHATADGETKVARVESENDQTLGDIKVANAAKNVDNNFGTASAMTQESKLAGFLNTLDIRNQAHAKAMGYTQQARSIRLQGTLNQGQSNLQAESAQATGVLNAGTRSLDTVLSADKHEVAGYERA